jgi:uncharacterized DUF497 family protein
MMQVSQFKWVPRVDSYTTAYNAMQPAVRFKKADCIDLPPVTVQDRQCDLSAEQKKAFNELKATMVADSKSGKQIKAVNAADQIGKLRQILCGAIKLGEDDYQALDHKPRLDVLLETISEASAKVLVIAPFKGIVRALEKEIEKHYSVGVLNGDVSPANRNKIIADFKSGPDPHILLCHPKVMSHGLNLTEADTLIFYAPIYSNDEFQQVTERFNRAGQKNSMTIVRMAAHPLEWEIYRLLANRQSTQNSILDLYKVVTGERNELVELLKIVAVLESMWDWRADDERRRLQGSAALLPHQPGQLQRQAAVPDRRPRRDLFVTNACRELCGSANHHGTPDPEWLRENLELLAPFDVLLVCGKVAQATYAQSGLEFERKSKSRTRRRGCGRTR